MFFFSWKDEGEEEETGRSGAVSLCRPRTFDMLHYSYISIDAPSAAITIATTTTTR